MSLDDLDHDLESQANPTEPTEEPDADTIYEQDKDDKLMGFKKTQVMENFDFFTKLLKLK